MFTQNERDKLKKKGCEVTTFSGLHHEKNIYFRWIKEKEGKKKIDKLEIDEYYEKNGKIKDIKTSFFLKFEEFFNKYFN